MVVRIPVSWGELFDKMTILKIKQDRISDGRKLINIVRELESLEEACRARQPLADGVDALVSELRRVNESLWDIEDEIRRCERDGDFSQRFIDLARSVYRTNDERAALKRQINMLLGSELIEEKSYEAY